MSKKRAKSSNSNDEQPTIVVDGKKYPRIPFGAEAEFAPCPGCNARKGEYHKPGCQMERCPQCGGYDAQHAIAAAAEHVAPPPSRWEAKSQGGRFIIDHDALGAVVIVDHLRIDPDDLDSSEGILVLGPEDADAFLKVLTQAADLHRAYCAARQQLNVPADGNVVSAAVNGTGTA